MFGGREHAQRRETEQLEHDGPGPARDRKYRCVEENQGHRRCDSLADRVHPIPTALRQGTRRKQNQQSRSRSRAQCESRVIDRLPAPRGRRRSQRSAAIAESSRPPCVVASASRAGPTSRSGQEGYREACPETLSGAPIAAHADVTSTPSAAPPSNADVARMRSPATASSTAAERMPMDDGLKAKPAPPARSQW